MIKKMTFDEYLKNILPDGMDPEEVKECLEVGTPVYITGDERTGKSTLSRVLKKHGYRALEEVEMLHIRLTKQIPWEDVIPNYHQNIE